MACSLPHTDSEIEALVQRLINKDKGRQDVLLDLAFQFEDSCAVRDDLRKTYEKCNDISRESRALICTLLKESSEKDRKLHLSMYGKAAQLEKQMGAKSAWFQEKYSGRTHGGIGCSSSQTDFPLTEKELHQLRMDEEARKEMLEEEAMNKKAQEEKIRQEQAENDAFFLDFGVVRYDSEYAAYRATHHCGDRRGSSLEEVASVGLGGLEFSEFVHDPQHACSRYQLPLSAILRSHFGQMRENPLQYQRSGALYSGVSHEEIISLLPEKVIPKRPGRNMASGKNGDDGDLLLFRDGPGACDISAGNTEGLEDMSRSVGFKHWYVSCSFGNLFVIISGILMLRPNLACLHRLPIMSLLFAFLDKVTFVNYWCVQAACLMAATAAAAHCGLLACQPVRLILPPDVRIFEVLVRPIERTLRRPLRGRGPFISAIPSKTAADAKLAIQEMAEYSQKWHNGISRSRSTETSEGLAAIQAQLNNLGREIKKVNEKVYAAQVGCEQCKGPHYTKDCLLKEEGKTLEEAYYTKLELKQDGFDGMITIHNGNDEVTYQMVRSHPRFKHHTNKKWNKIPPLLKVSEEDMMNGISHSYQKLKGFYKGVLNLGPEYIRDAKIEE
ncbi:hypothetical protein Tco_1043557 [Tanacetum coccineum]|uniref:Eukaryotic translation initiation factor 3 subunit G N-terminal domain-containing protein n=1 Tax=Tanacetum coccineum TaxID=301880 RepID=A0ABQ5GMF1_9ASTR